MLAKRTVKNQITLPKTVIARFGRLEYFDVSTDGETIVLRLLQISRADEVRCRDEKDQPFLNLARSGEATLLVSGDRDLLVLDKDLLVLDEDLLVLTGLTNFQIRTPEAYRQRVAGER